MPTTLRLLLVLALALLAVVMYTTRVREEMIDFVTWRRATVRALHAEPLYRAEDEHYQYKYFPFSALMMAPFGALDEDTGKLLWFTISIALLVALLRGSVTALPDRWQSRQLLIWITVLLMAKFYARELLLGQMNLLLGALLLATLLAVQRDRPVAAGVLAGLAVFVKPYALIMLPWLFVIKGWQAAAAAIAVVATGLLFPAIVYGWNGNLDLLRGWLHTVSESTPLNLLTNDNVSIFAMWAKWLQPGSVATALAWATLLAIAALAVVVWRRRQQSKSSSPEYLECALLMLLIPLISPQGWDYVLLLATPAVICLVDRWRGLTSGWRWGVGIALAIMGLTMFDVMGRELYGRFMALSVVTVCALAVGAGLVHLRWRQLA
jgi:hypothetical protein